VERWQTFVLQQTAEFKPIMENEVGRDFPCRADGASTEEHRFDYGPAPQREIGPRLVNWKSLDDSTNGYWDTQDQ